MHGSNSSGDATALLLLLIFKFLSILIRHPAASIRTEALTAPCSDTDTLLKKLMPFTEETVYNSDRHVAKKTLLPLSDAHAMEEVTFFVYKLNNRIQRR